MTTAETIRGRVAVTLPRLSKQYEPGRTCAAEGCDTQLSIYNRRDVCHRHATVEYPKLRGRTTS